MTLQQAHEFGFASAVTLALLSVMMGGALPAWLFLALAIPAASAWLRLRDLSTSTALGTTCALAGFAVAAMTLLNQGVEGSLVAATIALISILVARLVTRRTPSHDLQALVLSLLLVFAGTVLHQQFSYGVILVLYAVTTTWALVTRQLIAGAAMEGWRRNDAAWQQALLRRDVATTTFFGVTAVVAIFILLSTSFLFVLFPRVGLGAFGIQGRVGHRLPADVSLFGTPRATQGGNEVIARVRGVSHAAYLRGLYLRGGVYDQLTNGGFAATSLDGVKPPQLALAPSGRSQRYEVYLQPVTDQTLLTLGAVERARVLSVGLANPSVTARLVGVSPSGELMSLSTLDGPIRYTVDGSISTTEHQAKANAAKLPNDRKFVSHFLSLPSDLDVRIPALAQQLTAGQKTFAQRSSTLRNYLLNNYVYTPSQPNSSKTDPLSGFLFEDKRGHCEYFATAFAVLLRAAGLPSRVVGGYHGGTWDKNGDLVIFTGANAHAWVEWYSPGEGWLVDDATPPHDAHTLGGFSAFIESLRRFWDDEVVDYGLNQQLALVNDIMSSVREVPSIPGEHIAWTPLLSLLGMALACAGILYLLRRATRRTQSAAELSLLAKILLQTLERLTGAPIERSCTLREVLAGLSHQPLQTQKIIGLAIDVYEHERFADKPVSRQVLRSTLAELKRLPSLQPGARA